MALIQWKKTAVEVLLATCNPEGCEKVHICKMFISALSLIIPAQSDISVSISHTNST